MKVGLNAGNNKVLYLAFSPLSFELLQLKHINAYTENVPISIIGFLPYLSATTPQKREVKALPIMNEEPTKIYQSYQTIFCRFISFKKSISWNCTSFVRLFSMMIRRAFRSFVHTRDRDLWVEQDKKFATFCPIDIAHSILQLTHKSSIVTNIFLLTCNIKVSNLQKISYTYRHFWNL